MGGTGGAWVGWVPVWTKMPIFLFFWQNDNRFPSSSVGSPIAAHFCRSPPIRLRFERSGSKAAAESAGGNLPVPTDSAVWFFDYTDRDTRELEQFNRKLKMLDVLLSGNDVKTRSDAPASASWNMCGCLFFSKFKHKRRKEPRNNGGMKSLFKEILEEDKNADAADFDFIWRKKGQNEAAAPETQPFSRSFRAKTHRPVPISIFNEKRTRSRRFLSPSIIYFHPTHLFRWQNA